MRPEIVYCIMLVMSDTVQTVQQEFDAALANLNVLDQLQSLETSYLGRSGKVNELMKNIKDVPPLERKDYGSSMNELKKYIEQSLTTKKAELVNQHDAQSEIDVTLPGTPQPKGSLHMATHAIEEITQIFSGIGFIRMTYPEVEYEHFSFDALNIQPDHPARDDFETFFVEEPEHKKYGKMVLTPHTSSGQIREMMRLQSTPPIRMINIAKTYRPNWDASHVPMFHQFEGMVVDRNINITHLKGTIDYFAKAFFGPTRQIRLRPFHFQFTEPSFEVDITCGVCGGSGKIKDSQSQEMIKCKICKQGWLELGGSGMIHPNVLSSGGIDPQRYSGWAFGFGVERVMAMKEGLKLDDIRILYSGDVRFLEQF